MYDLSFLPAGDARRSGDAIALRFTRPDTGALSHVVIDAGYPGDGRRLTVEHVRHAWGVERVDLAILTHPDPDHVGGMEEVLSLLEVGTLWAHRPALHGDDRSRAARRVERLVTLAGERGTAVVEPWAGREAFGGALRVLGPEPAYYEELMSARIAPVFRGRLIGGLRWMGERLTLLLPSEVRFDDEEGVTRFNNGSTVMRLSLPGLRAVLTADAGVPALGRAWDDEPFDLVQIPHHGSKRNASSALLDRMLGPVGAWAGDPRVAVVSVAPGSRKHPSPRVLRGYARRGCEVRATAGRVVRVASDPEGNARLPDR